LVCKTALPMILHCLPPSPPISFCVLSCHGLVLSCPVPQYIMPFCPHVSPCTCKEFFPPFEGDWPVCPVIRQVCRTSGSPSLPPDLPYLGVPSHPSRLPYLGTLVFRHVWNPSHPQDLTSNKYVRKTATDIAHFGKKIFCKLVCCLLCIVYFVVIITNRDLHVQHLR
jgi:hypothetical protein